MKNSGIFFLILFSVSVMIAQSPVYPDPDFPTELDSVVVYFDATLGDSGLAGYTGAIYAHTGVITENSTGQSDWRYVIGEWGETDQPLLESLGNDLYKMVVGFPHDFYGCPDTEQILQLAFVFRSANGSVTGRDVGGADIFMDFYEPGVTALFITPTANVNYGLPERSPIFVNENEPVSFEATAATLGTELDQLKLIIDNVEVASTTNDTITYVHTFTSTGMVDVELIALATTGESDTISQVIFIPTVNEATRPENLQDGLTTVDNNSITLSLFAPYKDHVYVIGDFNDWIVSYSYSMNKDSVNTDSTYFWITLSGLSPSTEYGFQYLVDGDIRVTDPYAELVLHKGDDPWIEAATFPNLKEYPVGKTDEYVGVFVTNPEPYNWQATNYVRPAKEALVVYELLIRDFLHAHDYATLIDTLDYLDRLGITAIELMPVNEFEGNISWGYNPAFYFAPDKYYGSPESLKSFIDECHSRGIAVILDAVLNHSFGQSPMVRLYNEGNYGTPLTENPWYNVSARHPFNVGYDMNHESVATKYLVDRYLEYWLNEFQVDGFRFDLSKGFTQTNSGSDVGAWGNYDQSRIDIWMRIANIQWSFSPGSYVILEHFADNNEETFLASQGMMLWGNLNHNYSESSMGWLANSDLSWGYYGNRGWSQPSLMTYMESHDEQWVMYKNLQWGNNSGNYDITELPTALQRMKLVSAFFFTYPGPKMMWQFEELGYDEELPVDGRTDPKPIHWEYQNDPDRIRLYKTIQALLKLRSENEVFTDPATSVSMYVGNNITGRRIHLSHSSMDVTILGNFGVTETNITANFQQDGMWYEYFSGDSIEVSNTGMGIDLGPGDFRIYTTVRVDPPEAGLLSNESELISIPETFQLYQNYPNPFNPETTIQFSIPADEKIHLAVYDIQGRLVNVLVDGNMSPGKHSVKWNGTNTNGHPVASGMYIYKLKTSENISINKMVLMK
ncbi:MAG: T9SS type A sorting domain-containing protein [Candidatus Marinimicrobia bacterium]|nr:T9SS type A sorting domain-containing protein [Candidatus Neomarinimicrobiota bacterium]